MNHKTNAPHFVVAIMTEYARMVAGPAFRVAPDGQATRAIQGSGASSLAFAHHEAVK